MTGAIHGVVSLDSHLTGVPYTMRFALREVCIEVHIEVRIEKGLHCKVCMARSAFRSIGGRPPRECIGHIQINRQRFRTILEPFFEFIS